MFALTQNGLNLMLTKLCANVTASAVRSNGNINKDSSPAYSVQQDGDGYTATIVCSFTTSQSYPNLGRPIQRIYISNIHASPVLDTGRIPDIFFPDASTAVSYTFKVHIEPSGELTTDGAYLGSWGAHAMLEGLYKSGSASILGAFEAQYMEGATARTAIRPLTVRLSEKKENGYWAFHMHTLADPSTLSSYNNVTIKRMALGPEHLSVSTQQAILTDDNLGISFTEKKRFSVTVRIPYQFE